MVRKGEVVGIAGLMGSGRTELAMSLFGRSYGHAITGEVRVHGKTVDTSTIERAMKAGIAYVTEDRKTYGLVLINHVKHNVTLANHRGVSKYTVIDDTKELKVANQYRNELAIRCSGVFQTAVDLSGGNQQKVVLSKWLFAGPDILILRRADARHRCRREIRDLQHHQSAGRRGEGHHLHLVGNAGAARHHGSHLCDERGAVRSRNAGRRSLAGKNHAGHRQIMGRLR